MVKRSYAVIAALMAMVMLVVLGCAPSTPGPAPSPKPSPAPAPSPGPAPSPAAKPSPAPTPAPKLPDRFVFVMSGAGKSFNVAAYMSEMITKYTTMKGSVERVTSPAQALTMISDGDAQSAIYSAPSTLGVDQTKRNLLRALLCAAGPEGSTVAAIQTTKKSGITKVEDLKGKRVYAENPALIFFGPMMEAILKSYGMTKADIKWQIFSNADDAYRDLKEGRVDALFYVTGAGSTELAESAAGLYAVPLSPAAQKAVEETGLGYAGDVWLKGQFGNSVDTPTISSPNIVWSSTKMSDDVAYTFTKTIEDRLDELQKSQKAAEGYTKGFALVQWTFPYHPGAIKYYKEASLWKTEMDKKQADLIDKYSKK